MTDTMTNDQILTAAKNDIDNHIEEGTFKGYDEVDDNEENFYTITSLYAQWAEVEVDAEACLYEMYEDQYPDYDHENQLN